MNITVPLKIEIDEKDLEKAIDKYMRENPDMVEVVRCKDCKHSYFVKSCSKYECRKGCGTLKYSTDYCSYGERRSENDKTE